MSKTIDIVFDGPPSNESGRFVEVEDNHGKSFNAGEWIERDDGLYALRILDPRELAKLQYNLDHADAIIYQHDLNYYQQCEIARANDGGENMANFFAEFKNMPKLVKNILDAVDNWEERDQVNLYTCTLKQSRDAIREVL